MPAPYLIRKFGDTVFPEILGSVLWFTLIAVAFTILCDVGNYRLEVSTIMLSILSTMLSFVISLRTSSALERWNAGRMAWTQLSTGSRNLASLIWIHVGPYTLSLKDQSGLVPGSPEEEVEKVKALIEKRTMLNLLQAYSVATKHYVRGESGIYYDDLYPLVQSLPKYSFPSGIDDANSMSRDTLTGLWRSPMPDGSTVVPVGSSSAHGLPHPLDVSVSSMSSSATSINLDLEKGAMNGVDTLSKDSKRRKIRLAPGYNPPEKDLYHYAPIFRAFEPLAKLFDPSRRKPRKIVAATNVPLEIHMFISGYVQACISRGSLAAPYVGVIFGYLNTLSDALAAQERVLSSPLPFAYDVHLRAVTYAFLVFLPFQIFGSLGYLTILAEFVASVVFLGFLELGNQLQEPFGYDDSDLDLDLYCALLASELQEIAAHPSPNPAVFVWSTSNLPFQPIDRRSAPEILAEYSQEHGGIDQAAARGVPGMRRFLSSVHHQHEERGRKAHEAHKKAHKRRGSATWGSDDPREVEVCVV